MDKRELELQLEFLDRKFGLARPAERHKLRPSIDRLMRELKSSKQPIPTKLRRLGAQLDQESFDDMFDNMPV